jgi:activator of 2-hydroxyglutaryl-CoA dehydratase
MIALTKGQAAGRKGWNAALWRPDTGLGTANVMFLGIDVGTSGVKAVLIDDNDRIARRRPLFVSLYKNLKTSFREFAR